MCLSGLHLAGCKKVQQVLANPAELSNFIHPGSTNASAVTDFALLQSVFAGLYSLDQSEYSSSQATAAVDATTMAASLKPLSYSEIMSRAMAGPEKYVMKPQREGGGNNIYNEKVSEYTYMSIYSYFLLLLHVSSTRAKLSCIPLPD